MAAWKEIVSESPLGVLTLADRQAVKQTARLMVQSDWQGDDFPTSKAALLNKYLGQFGMTPTDRASLSIPKVKADNPFAGLRK